MGVIAKYKFNNTLEANLLPEFNSEFTSDLYTVTDEVNGEVTTRTIESDELPTLMRFGRVWVNGEPASDNRTDSLLEVLDMNTSGLTSCHSMFRYCANLTSITCEWDTSNVTNMHSMFDICYSLIILDVSNFNTSNVTDMISMFYNCERLTTLDVSNFNTNKVTNMNYMFQNCTKLTSLDVSNFNTSNVTNMSIMFSGCKSLTSLDVSNFDTSNVTKMDYMFSSCSSLTELDLTSFDTSKVTNMGGMFENCSGLTDLDVSSFDTSNATDIWFMFSNCASLTELDVSGFDTTKATVINAMFQNCSKLTSLDLSGFDTTNVTSMYNMFYMCSNLTSLDLSGFNTTNVDDMSNMFQRCSALKYLKCNNVTTLNTINTLLPAKSSTSQGTIICKSDITNLDTTVLQSKYWNILDEPTLIAKYVFDKSIHNNCIPEFNTGFEGYFIEDEVVEGSNEVTRTIESCGMLPTNLEFGYYTGGKLTPKEARSLMNVKYVDTSNLDSTYTFCMFANCTNLTSLDVSNFNTSNVTSMGSMFYGCNNLTSLDVSNFNTSKVANMSVMFSECRNLTSLDVSNFNTNNVNNMSYMFYGCNNLTSLNVSNFDTSKVTNTTNMFTNTPLLTDINVLYMDKSSLQKLVDAIPTDLNKTLWYKDVNIDGITHGDNITLKKYMEENVEIVLNSPLLEGDRIEIKDGKLCHYHKMGMVVFDGSEDWTVSADKQHLTNTIHFQIQNTKLTPIMKINSLLINNQFINHRIWEKDHEGTFCASNGNFGISILRSKLSTLDKDGFKQWLHENPITLVYELETPTYEDITNLQSVPTLKTYLECSMEIDTDLPIDTNVTYRTNLSSVYVMERELDELDNGTDLGDILEGEVNE